MADNRSDPIALWQKMMGEMGKGFNPFARPAPTPTMFCSAMPTLTKRSGNFDLKFFSFVDDMESFTTAQMSGSSAAMASRVRE